MSTESVSFESLFETLKQQLDKADSYEIVAEIRAAGSPDQQLELAGQLCRHLYRDRKDVSRMLRIGRLSLQQSLTQVQLSAGLNQQSREKTLGMIKTLSYNLSADAWPGWQDPGIEVSRSESLSALDLARLNLRLATELNRDATVHGHAHWLIGAHQLVLGDHSGARESFQFAADRYLEGGHEAGRLMSVGYSALALLSTDRERAESHLKVAGAALNELGTDDAKFFQKQLVSVRKWLENRQPGTVGSVK